jgi:hypothetical protein
MFFKINFPWIFAILLTFAWSCSVASFNRKMPLLIGNLVQAILMLVQMYQEDEITGRLPATPLGCSVRLAS